MGVESVAIGYGMGPCGNVQVEVCDGPGVHRRPSIEALIVVGFFHDLINIQVCQRVSRCTDYSFWFQNVCLAVLTQICASFTFWIKRRKDFCNQKY